MADIETEVDLEGNCAIETQSIGSNAIYTESAISWWNSWWPYRRLIRITPPPPGIEAGHPITTYVTRSIIQQGKVRDDLTDIRVAYLISNRPEVWKVIPSSVDSFSNYVRVRFNLPNAIYPSATPGDALFSEGTYFIYYGNKGLREDPIVATYQYDPYPLTVNWDDGYITYTNPDKDWIANVSQVRGAKANFTFYGEQIRLYANTGGSWGQALVTITNTDAPATPNVETGELIGATPSTEYSTVVDLYGEGAEAENLILTVTGLPEGIHHLRMEDLGTSNPLSNNVRINLTKIEYKKHGKGEDVKEEADSRMKWSTGMGGKT